MSMRAPLAATFVVAALAASVAAAAPTSTAALVGCGTVTAGGRTWQVAQAALRCSTARDVTRRVAVAKPDQVLHRGGGEIDRYRATFSGLNCFKAQKKGAEGQIQCTSRDGKGTILSFSRS